VKTRQSRLLPAMPAGGGMSSDSWRGGAQPKVVPLRGCLDAVVGDDAVWDVGRMRPLALEWDAAVRAEVPAYARLVPEAEARGSVLRRAATDAQVTAAEARLHVVLPPSYRAFLLVANGADAGRLGADSVQRLGTADPTGLLAVEDVVPLSDAVPKLVPMWREAMDQFADRQREPAAAKPTQVYDFTPGLEALLLTRPSQLAIVALVPFPGEWQVWEFDHSEVSAHQSLATYLQHQAAARGTAVARTDEPIRRAARPFFRNRHRRSGRSR
jgi:hypothetical protein